MTTSNPYAGTEHEATWAAGYEYGEQNPSDTSPTAPAPYDDNEQTVWQEGALAGRDDAAAAAPAQHEEPSQEPSVHLNPTGAEPSEVPASFQVGGLPVFRYNLPTIPIATAEVDTGEALVELTLGLRGNVSLTFQDATKWASLDQSGLRVEATKALGPITEGLRVSGFPDNVSVGVTMGSEYDATEVRFTPPNTMTFIGQARIHYTVESAGGPIEVQGQPGVELKVTVTPHPQAQPEPVTEPATREEFEESHKGVWAAIGVIALVAIAIVAAPETGGGSLVLLAV